ncbi:signal peptidase II [Indiicoccus explosivorum]|uniref:signal peptidase II n=1 Tax=Indiicoccus explosivorum TaxID=1917864 RepID=UPI000B436E7F|nr:signal peptidase II [Indiicoccus explosivorum]
MWAYYGIALLIVILDQWTKWIVVKSMELGERIPVWEPYLAWLSHRNRGAAWGMLEGRMWLFTIITLIVIGFIVYYFHRYAKDQPFFQATLMVLLGGAIGNFIDRLWRGEVVDFVDILIPVIGYDFPIFNVADIALTVGVIMMVIYVWNEEKQEKKKVS